jgi:hypothetical protein
MRLPNADQSVVDIRKLKDYCLDRLHPRGKHKARVFEHALGLTKENAEELRDEILKRVPHEEALIGEEDDYGRRFVVDFEYIRQGRRARIRTCWILKTGENAPRLTSCFVL